MRPQRAVHVFLSSTWLDLRLEREAVEAALQRLRETKLVGMEYFGSRNETTSSASLDEVDRSQAYVVLIGRRYGSGITEAEYRRARQRAIPCFVYFKEEAAVAPDQHDDDEDEDKTARLAALREDLRRSHLVSSFRNPDELAAKVTADLHRWLVEGHIARHAAGVLGAPFQAPPLPNYFVERPDASQDLRDRLLGADRAPGAIVISAIHGLAGVGKSTLAASLAHDPMVRDRFPDGVLWATLGQQPDLLPVLSGWIQALGDCDFHPTSVEPASAHLRSLLWDKAVLVVADDTWDAAPARLLHVGGPRCLLIITTRDALIAKGVGAELCDLDVMTSAQAIALLSGRLGRTLGGLEFEQAIQLAGAVGYLPLALELAAAQVADGITWGELLDDLKAEIGRLESLELPGAHEVTDEASYKRLSLRGSFNISLRRLSGESLRCFAWLGVLPEDVTISAAMAATLWSTDAPSARITLRLLRDKAILLPGVPLPDGTHTYRLHDLVHELAKTTLTDCSRSKPPFELPGLGLTIAEAHSLLLERYRRLTGGGKWHTIADDGYIHTYLTWHIEKSQRNSLIHSLLQEETTDRRNGWYQSREKLGQTAGYIADVARAWRLTEQAEETQLSLNAVGLQCRYGLLIASLNSLARNFMPDLLVSLVERGVWPRAQGIAYARQVPDLLHRAEALAKLTPTEMGPEQLETIEEVLSVGRSIVDGWGLAALLRSIGSSLSGKTLTEAIDLAGTIRGEGPRINALSRLISYLPEQDRQQPLRESLTAARGAWSEADRATALIALAPLLPKDLLQEALVATSMIADEGYRAEALAALARRLCEQSRNKVQREALALARSIPTEGYRGVTLAGLSQWLPEQGRRQVLREALTAARGAFNEHNQSTAIVRLAPLLPEPWLQEALDTALAIGDEKYRSEAIASLAPRLSSQLVQSALESAWRIKDEVQRSKVLAALVPHIPQHERTSNLRRALDCARVIRDEASRSEALSFLSSLLPEPWLREALDAVQTVGDEKYIDEALIWLAHLLPEPERAIAARKALRAARAIADRATRAETVAQLAPLMSRPDREIAVQEELSAARLIGDRVTRARVLARLAPVLPEPDMELIAREELASVGTITHKETRAEVLAQLAPFMPQPKRDTLASEAVSTGDASLLEPGASAELTDRTSLNLALPEISLIARTMANDGYQQGAIERLILKFPKQLTSELRNSINALGTSGQRWMALARLAPMLPDPERGLTVQQALTDARAITNNAKRADALARLAPLLSQPERNSIVREALVAAREIRVQDSSEGALATLVPHLAETHGLTDALALARAIGNEARRAEALTGLIPLLSGSERETAAREALADARSIGAKSLIEPTFPDSHSDSAQRQAIQEVWSSVRLAGIEAQRSEALARLAPLLPPSERQNLEQEASKMAKSIRDVLLGVERLIRVASIVPEPWQDRAVQDASDTMAHSFRAVASLILLMSERDRAIAAAEAVAAAREIRVQDSREEALAVLLPRLAEIEGPAEALKLVRTIGDDAMRAEALAGLASVMPERERATVAREALALARSTRNEVARRETLLDSALRHTPEQQRQARQDWARTERRSKVLGRLAPLLPEPERQAAVQEALAALRTIEENTDQSKGHRTNVPESLYRATALSRLATLLPEPERETAVREALAAVWEIRAQDWRDEALAALLRPLAELRGPADAHALARNIGNDAKRAEALTELARSLPERERVTVARDALAAARDAGNEATYAKALTGLAPLLPEHERETAVREVLAAARAVGNEVTRAEALAQLAILRPEPEHATVVRDALDAARAIGSDTRRAEALTQVLPMLPEAEWVTAVNESLQSIRKINDFKMRIDSIVKLAIAIMQIDNFSLRTLWSGIGDSARFSRKDLLLDMRTLALVIATLGGPEAIREMFRAIEDMRKWWA
ncbi:MAG: DUF4062 domain-containing protein [Isosphaeraceae bacterium]